MWHTTHEPSATQIHYPTYNAYQHYTTNQVPHHHPSHHNGNIGKWNVAGQRSSYSLPHPGHTQSNLRWNKYEDKSHLIASKTQPARHFSNSTRNLATTNIPILCDQRTGGVGLARHRPASMYDPPNSMPSISYQFHSSSFMPHPDNFTKKDAAKHHAKNNVSNIPQSPADLVRSRSGQLNTVY